MKKIYQLICLLVVGIYVTAQDSSRITTAVPLKTILPRSTSLPDLSISIQKISYKKQDTVYTISYLIQNKGQEAVDLQEVLLKGNVFNDVGSLVQSGCEKLISKRKSLLKAGSSIKGEFSCKIPLYISQQPLSYHLQVDAGNKIREADERNNEATAAISAYLDIPDLVIESASLTWLGNNIKNGQPHRKFRVNFVIKNLSNVPASLDLYVIGNFGATANCAGCGNMISGTMNSNLKIGPWASFPGVFECNIPESQIQPGATYSLAVDCFNRIKEKVETNNTITINVPVN